MKVYLVMTPASSMSKFGLFTDFRTALAKTRDFHHETGKFYVIEKLELPSPWWHHLPGFRRFL